ncbi:hypothetical protein [Sphingopyxis sp.]|uniref:hypothetical protein n=1 Tax=Sphingopyxis sp. TaxID=1908224 RepID=UPI003BACB9CC
MARPLLSRRAEGNGSPWILKQVQDDEKTDVVFRSKAVITPRNREPGGSACSPGSRFRGNDEGVAMTQFSHSPLAKHDILNQEPPHARQRPSSSATYTPLGVTLAAR